VNAFDLAEGTYEVLATSWVEFHTVNDLVSFFVAGCIIEMDSPLTSIVVANASTTGNLPTGIDNVMSTLALHGPVEVPTGGGRLSLYCVATTGAWVGLIRPTLTAIPAMLSLPDPSCTRGAPSDAVCSTGYLCCDGMTCNADGSCS